MITEDDIIYHESLLVDAMKAGDVSSLDRLLHDDLLFVLPGGQAVTKETDLETYRSGALKIDALHPQTESMSLIGDSAIVIVHVSLKGSYLGEPFEARYRYIRFWKASTDGIRVVGGSGTMI